jgi:hypothetical protein
MCGGRKSVPLTKGDARPPTPASLSLPEGDDEPDDDDDDDEKGRP